jgi:hypothetical protein
VAEISTTQPRTDTAVPPTRFAGPRGQPARPSAAPRPCQRRHWPSPDQRHQGLRFRGARTQRRRAVSLSMCDSFSGLRTA